MKRWCVLFAALLLAGCTDQAQPRPTTPATAAPSPVACSLGELRFGRVEHGYLVVEASPVMTVTAPGGGPVDQPRELLRRPRVAVRAGAEVPHEYVYQELADKFPDRLADYGAEYQPAPAGSGTVFGPGRFVDFEALQTIDVTFTYECGGVTSRGSVTTWRDGGMTGLVNCEVPVKDPDPAQRAMLQQVVDLRC